jgi:hypothetical protein
VPSPFIQARVSRELRDRCEAAAKDCDVPIGTWLRMVAEDACDAHEDVELVPSSSQADVVYEVRAKLGLCTCPGFVNHGNCKHLPSSWQDVAETYDSAAQLTPVLDLPEGVQVVHPPGALREDASIPVEKQEVSPPLNPRDCPHLPSMRGPDGRCRCGTRVGGRSMMRGRW